jgi:hypothetical protein
MGNTGVTYEQYLELLKQPKGGEISLIILDTDGKTTRPAMIDPRQGFSLLLTDKLKMPVSTNGIFGDFFGVDGKGRLLFATNEARHWPYGYPKQDMFGVPIQDFEFLRAVFGAVLDFGFFSDKCLLNGDCMPLVELRGGEPADWLQILDTRTGQQIANKTLDFPFGLETP